MQGLDRALDLSFLLSLWAWGALWGPMKQVLTICSLRLGFLGSHCGRRAGRGHTSPGNAAETVL